MSNAQIQQWLIANPHAKAQLETILGGSIGPLTGDLNGTPGPVEHKPNVPPSDPLNTTVFVGGLSPLISEETLRTFFAPFGAIHYVKVPPGKSCGFVQYVRKSDAERAIEALGGFSIGGSKVRLSWGRSTAIEYSIFVGDIAADVTNADLMNVFRNPNLGLRGDFPPRLIAPFLSCCNAKVMVDSVTGISKGYGFVRFTSEADQKRALLEMQGLYCKSRPSKYCSSLPSQLETILGGSIGPLTGDLNGGGAPVEHKPNVPPSDPLNTTVFVGGLSPLISEETLRTFFAPFGAIHYVKVPPGKSCGFVQYVRKSDAERAIEALGGFSIGGSKVRLSWGR
ncbi:hypothetical protein M408DRAFT_82634, partial [Serendipita vermifera MAFF 305830]